MVRRFKLSDEGEKLGKGRTGEKEEKESEKTSTAEAEGIEDVA